MWSTVWFSFTFFELYAYFMIYSFLGWAMESTYVSINAKKWVNRGFINGPFCPIYGTGALLILLALKPVSDSILLLFLGGFVIATVVEYLIGLILESFSMPHGGIIPKSPLISRGASAWSVPWSGAF